MATNLVEMSGPSASHPLSLEPPNNPWARIHGALSLFRISPQLQD
jgi:hypothetical protein